MKNAKHIIRLKLRNLKNRFTQFYFTTFRLEFETISIFSTYNDDLFRL